MNYMNINPNDIVRDYGADTLRFYEMFMGPLEADKPWDNNGIEGSRKFLDRIWRLYTEDNRIQDVENKNLQPFDLDTNYYIFTTKSKIIVLLLTIIFILLLFKFC